MDLKRVTIKLSFDGFRIIDKGAGLQPGEILHIQYEADEVWTTKEVAFEREAPTFFHPFRKSMFVYTGARPTRVLIRAMDDGFTDDLDTGVPVKGVDYRRSYYDRGNFSSYPDYDDDAWDSADHDSLFRSSHPSHPTSSSHSAPDESAAGRIGLSPVSTDAPPPPPPPPPTTPASESPNTLDFNAPLERDSRDDEAAAGRVGESSASFVDSPSLERESSALDSGASDSGSSDFAASGSIGESASSEPNAY